MAKKQSSENRAVVIGLGRFGGSLALELVKGETEVLALDRSERLVDDYADDLTHVAVVDCTDAEALRQLDVHHFPRAVVAIGADLEASILCTSVLADFGVPNIWAKALSRQHARILERVGAHHVVLPEHDMGERVAHLVMGRMLDYIEFEDDYAMVKTLAPREAVGRPLGESELRRKYGITVVSIKRRGGGSPTPPRRPRSGTATCSSSQGRPRTPSGSPNSPNPDGASASTTIRGRTRR